MFAAADVFLSALPEASDALARGLSASSRPQASMSMLLLAVEADRTRTSITLLALALIGIAFCLTILTAWYWRYTDPARVEQAGDRGEAYAGGGGEQLSDADAAEASREDRQQDALDADAWLMAHDQLDERVGASTNGGPAVAVDAEQFLGETASSEDPDLDDEFTGLESEVWTAIADAVLRQASEVPVSSEQPTPSG